MSSGQLEAFSYLLFLFAQRHPRCIYKLRPIVVESIMGRHGRRPARRGVYTECVEMIFGAVTDKQIKRMLSIPCKSRIDTFVDALNIPFKGRGHVLDLATRYKHGRAILAKLRKLQKGGRP